MGEIGESFNYDNIKLSTPKKNKPLLNWGTSDENMLLQADKERSQQGLIEGSKKKLKYLSRDFLISHLDITNEKYSGDDYLYEEKEDNIFDYLKEKSESGIAQMNDILGKNELVMCKPNDISGKTQAELRIYQDKLIEKILGTNKGFDDKYIKGYMDDIGNYLMEIKNYEEYIGGENAEDINSILLANYLQFLNSKGKLNVWTLREKFGNNLLNGIGELWKNNEGGTIAQKLLKEAGIEKIINKVASFNDIINSGNITKTIDFLKPEELPTKEEIEQTSIDKLNKFNNKYTGYSCPFLKPENKEKYEQILSLSKQVELERQEENLNKLFEKHIIKRLKDKYSGKIPEALQKNMEESSKVNLEILLNLIENKPCAFTLLSEGHKLEEQFFKENKEFLQNTKSSPEDSKELVLGAINFHKVTKSIEKEEIIKQLVELNRNPTKNKKQIKKLNTLLEKNKKKSNIDNRMSEMVNNITIEQLNQYEALVNNGVSEQEASSSIIQQNEKLQKIFKKYNEKFNSEVENKENHNEEEDHSNYNFDKDDYLPNTEQEGGFNIKIGGVEIKGLTKKEKENTMGNPEALKNLVDFYQFFKDLNLEGVWKYRGKLTTTIGSRYININDNNSISKAELLKFGNALINIINNIPKEEQDKNTLKRSNSISAIKNELRKYSGASSSLNNEQTYNINGEDKFTSQLRGLGIIGGAYFHTAQLRELTK